MLHLISPAKTLDFTTAPVTSVSSTPRFLQDSQELIEQLRALAPDDVASLMSISQKLGELNHARFHDWHLPFTADNAKQAVLAFKGDVYTGMNAESFSASDFEHAQQHLRILSGLYGLLRPLDLIQPYRLEMGTQFANLRGKNLYEFWGMQLTEALNQELSQYDEKVLINLASNEYWSAVKPKQLAGNVITPIFKDTKNGKQKIISFYAKKARGMMSAFIIQNKIERADEIKQFDIAGYRFEPKQSTATEWVFTRPEITP
jgi:cytoplasmic iron level regulating protein YaaA (DUF328/UPF0246 family)